MEYRHKGYKMIPTEYGFDIAIPDKTPASFSVVSIAGAITNNLSKNNPIPGRFGRGAELTMDASGGGAKVSVRTFKGPVTLRRMN